MGNLKNHPAATKGRAAKAEKPVTPGQFIRACREHYGMTQGELAEKAGCRQGHLSYYENDRILPNLITVAGLCSALHWKPMQLMQFIELVLDYHTN